jgi:hypothetical protein
VAALQHGPNPRVMNTRPRSITVVSWLFIAAGGVGLVYHLSELASRRPSDFDIIVISLIRLVAIISGVWMLRGGNWARWLLVVWMAYHIVLSAFHSPLEVVLHTVLFGGVAYFLFRPQASAYFCGTGSSAAQSPARNSETTEEPPSHRARQ